MASLPQQPPPPRMDLVAMLLPPLRRAAAAARCSAPGRRILVELSDAGGGGGSRVRVDVSEDAVSLADRVSAVAALAQPIFLAASAASDSSSFLLLDPLKVFVASTGLEDSAWRTYEAEPSADGNGGEEEEEGGQQQPRRRRLLRGSSAVSVVRCPPAPKVAEGENEREQQQQQQEGTRVCFFLSSSSPSSSAALGGVASPGSSSSSCSFSSPPPLMPDVVAAARAALDLLAPFVASRGVRLELAVRCCPLSGGGGGGGGGNENLLFSQLPLLKERLDLPLPPLGVTFASEEERFRASVEAWLRLPAGEGGETAATAAPFLVAVGGRVL